MRGDLKSAICTLHQIPVESPLKTAVFAGSIAIPRLLKMARMMEQGINNYSKWNSLSEFPIEVPLPFYFHSLFACPVSRDIASKDNPPILLKCHHVICQKCVILLSKTNTIRFKCPTCPIEQRSSETRPIFF